jgi:transcriptional regulator with XRE-family HTH domain
MTFGEKLRELREQLGLSEAKLAEKSGVSFGAIHNYGLGLRKPTFAAVIKLSKALEVTCEVFALCEDLEDAAPKKSQQNKQKSSKNPTRRRKRPD